MNYSRIFQNIFLRTVRSNEPNHKFVNSIVRILGAAGLPKNLRDLLRVDVFASALLALALVACGDSRSNTKPQATSAPQASSGRAVLYGSLIIAPGACGGVLLVLAQIRDSSNNMAYSKSLPAQSSYQVDLDPGTYVFTAQAGVCIFAQSVTLTSGQSIQLSPILQ